MRDEISRNGHGALRRTIERRRVARHGRDNAAGAAIQRSTGNDDAGPQRNTASCSVREYLAPAVVELTPVQHKATAASRLEEALIDEPASMGSRHGHDRRRRDDQAGRRTRRIDDAATLIDELDGIRSAELSSAADRGVDVGDNLGPAVREAKSAVCRLGAEDDRAPSRETDAIGKKYIGQIARAAEL